MSRLTKPTEIILRKIPFMTEDVRRLYLSSFPPEERRPLHFLEHCISNNAYSTCLLVAELNKTGTKQVAGFLTLWQLDQGLYYIEHFAVEPSLRGQGIGAWILHKLHDSLPEPSVVIIEVEKPDTEIARRRIDFYKRCGFILHQDYQYIQPPYSHSLPEVEMNLMTQGYLPDRSIDAAAHLLRSIVYRK